MGNTLSPLIGGANPANAASLLAAGEISPEQYYQMQQKMGGASHPLLAQGAPTVVQPAQQAPSLPPVHKDILDTAKILGEMMMHRKEQQDNSSSGQVQRN